MDLLRKLLVSQCWNGYPRLAAFLDSDDNFMIYRRFGYIQSRLLLDKGDELRRLENSLDELDDKIGKRNPGSLTTTDLTSPLAKLKKDLMAQLKTAFCEYGE
jgi:hypothetical protein